MLQIVQGLQQKSRVQRMVHVDSGSADETSERGLKLRQVALKNQLVK